MTSYTNMTYVPEILSAQEMTREAGALRTLVIEADAAAVAAVRRECEFREWDGRDLVAGNLTSDRPWRVRIQNVRR